MNLMRISSHRLSLSSAIQSNRTLLLIIVCMSFSIFPHTLSMAETVNISETTEPANSNTTAPPFEYQMENRADPFVPFITEKAAVSSMNMDEVIENNEPLTGMQLFEPGQLTLVAIIKKGSDNLAMVQDTTGKGYTITEGTKIGRRGLVKSFSPQSVTIEETTVTRAGKKTVTEVVMVLKKEGEK
jgi:Tfp pilus assembly protein PilP